jgi:hypothetical protein
MKRTAPMASVEDGPDDLGLSSAEMAQVAQVARELAALMELPDDPRILAAAHDMLRLFVVDGQMPVPVAIDTLSRSLTLTLERMARQEPQH